MRKHQSKIKHQVTEEQAPGSGERTSQRTPEWRMSRKTREWGSYGAERGSEGTRMQQPSGQEAKDLSASGRLGEERPPQGPAGATLS